MKRHFVIVVVCMIASISSVAFGQNDQTVTVKKPVYRGELIEQVIKTHGFKMMPESLPFTDTWFGELNLTNLPRAMEQLLSGTNYEAVAEGQVVKVQPKTRTAPAQEPSVADRIAKLKARLNTEPSMAEINRINFELGELQDQADRERFAIRDSQTRQMSGPSMAEINRMNFALGMRDSGFSGYGWSGYDYETYWRAFDTCVANPGHTDCQFGDFKIEGDRKNIASKLSHLFSGKEDKLSRVDVWIQGPIPFDAPSADLDKAPVDVIGVASDLDGILDKPRRLPIGRYRIRMVMVDQNVELYEQTVRLYSTHNEKGKATKVRVDDGRFRYSPLKTELVQSIRRNVPAENVLGISPDLR